jgi:hypothetical protein
MPSAARRSRLLTLLPASRDAELCSLTEAAAASDSSFCRMAPRVVEFLPAEATDAALDGGDASSAAKCCGMENNDEDDDTVCEAVDTFDDDNDDADAAEDRNAVDWNAENDEPLASALGEELGKDGEETMRCDSCGEGDADGVSL